MSLSIVILLIALALIFILRLNRKLALLAEQIRGLRANAMEDVSYKPVGDVDFADALVNPTHEAEQLGFKMLGDYAETTKQSPVATPRRWFVDPAGTTFGCMAPFDLEGQKHTVIVLMSHELDRQVISTRQPRSSMLSRPPFVEMQQIPSATSFKETLAKHRTFAKLDDIERGWVPVKTFDELRHELDRMRGKVIEWRQAQPAAALLDADLRALLGPQYAKLGTSMKRRLV